MKTRMKFTKAGPLKFIGHLDIMRYFQKAFRRAEIDVEYSKGFSPHQLMSFAAPLGVGLTSDGEYLDVQLLSVDDRETMLKRINEVMAADIQVVDFKVLPDTSKNAMSIVSGADYLISLKDSYEFLNKEEFQEKFLEFMNLDTIVVLKKSKKTEAEIDIKPFIYEYSFTPFKEENMPSVADVYENGVKVYLKLATGSVNNLKPELVLQAFCNWAGMVYNEFAFQGHRIEVYANAGNEENIKLVPLNCID